MLRPTPMEAKSPPLYRFSRTSDSFRRFAHRHSVRGKKLKFDFVEHSPAASSSRYQNQAFAAFHANQLRSPVKRLVTYLSVNPDAARSSRICCSESYVLRAQRK